MRRHRLRQCSRPLQPRVASLPARSTLPGARDGSTVSIARLGGKRALPADAQGGARRRARVRGAHPDRGFLLRQRLHTAASGHLRRRQAAGWTHRRVGPCAASAAASAARRAGAARASQSRTVPSAPPVTKLPPSGWIATDSTQDAWHCSSVSSSPLSESKLRDGRRGAGLRAWAQRPRPGRPASAPQARGPRGAHRLTWPSSQAVARVRPSGKKARERTGLNSPCQGAQAKTSAPAIRLRARPGQRRHAGGGRPPPGCAGSSESRCRKLRQSHPWSRLRCVPQASGRRKRCSA